jgi:hypothetical protein
VSAVAVTTQSWAIFETAKAWLPTINVQAALSSVGSSIKYSIISPQTYLHLTSSSSPSSSSLSSCSSTLAHTALTQSEETFGKIAAIVSQFFADVEVSYSELIMGLMLLSSTCRSAPRPCSPLPQRATSLTQHRARSAVCQRKLRETIRTDIPVTRVRRPPPTPSLGLTRTHGQFIVID